MSSLALSGGSLVRPTVSVAPGALVGVEDYAIASTSLAEAGWTGVGTGAIPMQGVSYNNWTRIENIGSANAELARGFVSYKRGIDDLLVFYALTQPEFGNDAAATVAFMSAIKIPAGCQCAAGAATGRQVVLPTATAGRCTLKSRSVTPYGCDLLGDKWCETADIQAWAQASPVSDGTCACTPKDSSVHRVVSAYTPNENFGPVAA
eukprot:TRINITY_DN4044_c0_g1_i2.p1 TRINITY_DN4044_c0_g1~~TRINITY_DN4044_c0_g1_i2.p1  ORF type:complete len:206 (-),score=80.02 TRINITY_DN4044_c0_g1_i2:170-787(-)